MHSAQRPSRWMVILAFGLVYLFWGSTYLAIDIAVQTIPPALMCALRFSVAGVVMLAVCAATGHKILYSPQADRTRSGGRASAAHGRESHALLRGTHGLFRPVGIDHRHHAALVSRARFTSCWAITISRVAARLDLSWASSDYSFWFGRICRLAVSAAASSLASLSLIAGSFSWALGSVLSKRWQSGMDVFSATAWQVTAAGVGNFVYALANGDLATSHGRHVASPPRDISWSAVPGSATPPTSGCSSTFPHPKSQPTPT